MNTVALARRTAARSVLHQQPRLFATFRTDCGLHVEKDLPKPFDKILVANRGEIACRVIRTARALGVRTVAVFSDADEDAMHVRMADEAIRIGEAPANQSYLRGDVILAAARKVGAQAVHPGYGFLSENADFAEQCQAAGVKFIGPPTQAIVDMGSKSASKRIMEAAGVACVPGYHGDDQSLERLRLEADRIGFPLMIKAVLGGGGKGMRVVHKKADLETALEACRGEALGAFGDDRVLLERFIARSRHVEFQVFADAHGNVVHLCERDCSVQRRNQKVLEEAPAPGMTQAMRDTMGASAVAAARAVGYEGAGTVEFIVDADTNEYFFMEMNTRLQVEHPVTEMLVDRDLVQLQLHVAAGHELPFEQSQVMPRVRGHAIEARVYAEQPHQQFLPATGTLLHVRTPEVTRDNGVRVETGVQQGDAVSVFYDPMVAKLVVHAADRRSALRQLDAALRRYQVVGLETNLDFLRRCAAHADFQKGGVDTNFIPENMAELLPPADAKLSSDALVAGVTALLQEEEATSLWSQRDAFVPNLVRSERVVEVQTDASDDFVRVAVRRVSPHSLSLRFARAAVSDGSTDGSTDGDTDGDSEMTVTVTVQQEKRSAADPESGHLRLRIGDLVRRFDVVRDGRDVFVFDDAQHGACAQDDIVHRFALRSYSYEGDEGAHNTGAVAPMPGHVVSLRVSVGDRVEAGETLMVLEAMKMRHDIVADKSGVVQEVFAAEGDFVDADALLVDVQPAPLEQQLE